MTNVITFPHRTSLSARTAKAVEVEPEQAGLATTAKNARIRIKRREAWRKADATSAYWSALWKFTDAADRARDFGVKEALDHRASTFEFRMLVYDAYRDALARQVLTPAPDLGAVNWKRKRGQKSSLEKSRIEKVIADDIAFLSAHPTRRPRQSVRAVQS